MIKRCVKIFLPIVIICIALSFSSFAQAIKRIELTANEACEFCRNDIEYQILFEINSNHELVSTSIKRNGKRIRRREKIIVERKQIDQFIQLRSPKKSVIKLQELNIERALIENRISSSDSKLHFDLPDEIILNIDSFTVCQSYFIERESHIGGDGDRINILIHLASGEIIKFGFNSSSNLNRLNLKDYFSCSTLLHDKIPTEFPYAHLFSANHLADVIVAYLKTIECEDFYYREFLDKSPQMPARERRMRVGWNFIEYLKQRKF